MWMQHPRFKSKLEEWWNIEVEGTALFKVATKLRNVKKEAKIQNKRCFGNIFEIKPKIKEELKIIQDRIQKEGCTSDLVREENGKLVEYHDIVTKEEIYQRKRSLLVWLKEGDKKTRFFHLSTMKHKAKTHISNLMIGDIKITEEKEILKELVSFFASLMTIDPNIDLLNQEEILRVIPSLNTKDQNIMQDPFLMIRKFISLSAPQVGINLLAQMDFLCSFFKMSGIWLGKMYVVLSKNSLGLKVC